MTATPDHATTDPGSDNTAQCVSRVRGHIGDAVSSTAGLIDLLTAGLAEDDRHTAHQNAQAAELPAGLPDEHGEHDDRLLGPEVGGQPSRGSVKAPPIRSIRSR